MSPIRNATDGAVDVRREPRRESAGAVDNPVVVEALRYLMLSANVLSGLVHPDDRHGAVQMFRLLRDGGEAYDPQAVRAWAIQNGWAARSADDLRDIAQAVLDRKVRTTARTGWRVDVLESWRRQAQAGR